MPFDGIAFTEVIGYLAGDPKTSKTTGGTEICEFSIPVKQGWGENVKTEWYNCVAFGRLAAAIAKHATKGTVLRVTGQMDTQKWKDKNGNDQQRTKLIVDSFKFLPGGKKQDAPADKQSDFQPPAESSKPDDDLPF